jgi:MFS family permease
MEDKNQYMESIQEIRSMMERSSKFMSLSGLSGIGAGITALISGTIASIYLGYIKLFDTEQGGITTTTVSYNSIIFFLILAVATILVAIALSYVFTRRNAKKKNLPIWNKSAKLVTVSMLIPLITGGLFILALVFKFKIYGLVAPSMLIFYGLALVNAGKYTVSHTHWLGLAEIAIGLAALWFYGFGLIFWMLGFGIFHLVYGTAMYFKFERNNH